MNITSQEMMAGNLRLLAAKVRLLAGKIRLFRVVTFDAPFEKSDSSKRSDSREKCSRPLLLGHGRVKTVFFFFFSPERPEIRRQKEDVGMNMLIMYYLLITR